MSADIQHHSGEKIFGDVGTWKQGRIQLVEIRRPPNNFFDTDLINSIADAYEVADADDEVRAVVLCAAGKHFCAGADFSRRGEITETTQGKGGQSDGREGRAKRALCEENGYLKHNRCSIGLGCAWSMDTPLHCPRARLNLMP